MRDTRTYSMRIAAWLLVLLAMFALTLVGCNRQPTEAASNAAPPAMRAAVGPVPGPGSGPDKGREPVRNPYADSRGALTEGRQLFVRFNCSGCHGGRAGGGMGPSLRDVDWLYGHEDAQIFSSIAEGRAHGMPAWGTKLTDDQIWKLVAYVHSLRTPDEPEAPR